MNSSCPFVLISFVILSTESFLLVPWLADRQLIFILLEYTDDFDLFVSFNSYMNTNSFVYFDFHKIVLP